MEIYTIGFTKKTAAEFFESLKHHEIERLVDVRVNNTSQLAAFANRDDLSYLLRELVGADYVHEPLLALTKELLSKGYRDGDLDSTVTAEVPNGIDIESPAFQLKEHLTYE